MTEEILQNLYAMLAFEHWHKGRLSTIVDNYCERFLDYLLMNMYDEDLQRTKEYRRLQRLSNRIADEYLLR